MSVRLRAALVAALCFGVVATVAAVIGVNLLRTSLIDEIDRSIDTRARDLEIQTADEDFAPFVGEGQDPSTVAAIVDVDGVVASSTDEVDGAQLVELYRANEGHFDVALPELRSVLGSESMRAVTVRVDESNDFIETFVFVAASTAAVERTVDSTRLALLFLVPILVAVVGALVYVLTGRALRPVEQIRQEVEEINAKHLDRRVTEPDTGDEIAALAHTMNSMLTRVERADEEQRRFVADASHELRTPLTSISTRLDVDLARPEAADWAATAADLRRDATRMRHLVDDLLLLARGEGASVTREAVPMDDVIIETVAAIRLPESSIQIDTTGVERVDADGDPAQLRRLVANLITNAQRHATSRIGLSLRGRGAGFVELVVDDDGTGIPPEDRERVFGRFVRLDEARDRDAGGSGLGLAICAEIVQRHRGSIEVHDSPLGGARLAVTLPATT